MHLLTALNYCISNHTGILNDKMFSIFSYKHDKVTEVENFLRFLNQYFKLKNM